MSGLAADGYYSFDDLRGGTDGLVRVSGRGLIFERAGEGEWVPDQTLARHFTDPGSTFLEPADRPTAERLAQQYGVELA